MTYFDYIKKSKSQQVGFSLWLAILFVPLMFVPFFGYFPLLVFMVILVFLLNAVIREWCNFKKIKEPTWRLIDWINMNAESIVDGQKTPLYAQWWLKERVMKGEEVLYSKDCKCFNQHEHEAISEFAISNLQTLWLSEVENCHKQKREAIAKAIQEDLV